MMNPTRFGHLACVLVVVLLLCALDQARGQYTNVLYVGVTSTNGAYGAANYVNACKNVPSAVLTRYPACAQGSPLSGLRVSGNLTQFHTRLVPGSVVGPSGLVIADSRTQFFGNVLQRTLAQAGLSCSTFFSAALPISGNTPSDMNDGCALGFNDFLGSNSALRSYQRGNCTSTSAGSWFSSSTVTCSSTTSLLCSCFFLNTPTGSPTTRPSGSPSTIPSRTPSSSPTLPTQSPTHSPSRTPSTIPTKSPSEPTASPTLPPTTLTPTLAPSMPTSTPTLLPTSMRPSRAPSFSPTFRPTFGPAVTNVIYMASSSHDGDYGANTYINACATIPSNVKTNYPYCSGGTPLASLRVGGQVTDFNSRLVSGNVVGPNGFVIADNVTQFYTKPLRMTLAAAEVGCSSTFFSGSLTTGLANTGATECAKSSTGDFLADDDDKYSYRRGSCTSTAVGWFSTGSTKCESKTSFLCVCRVLVTPSPVPMPTMSPIPPTPPTGAPTSLMPSLAPTLQPSNPSKTPTAKPTTGAPSKRPTTSSPTFGESELNVIYLGESSVKGKYGASNYINTCQTIPDTVLDRFPLCSAGMPLASLRRLGVTTQFRSRITSGSVVGPAGVLIAQSPVQFYTRGLNHSLTLAGIPCTRFFSGTLTSGLANTGKTECATSSTGDFLADDDDDLSYRYGSCTSTSATWYSTGTGNCEDTSTSLLCFCRVLATSSPTPPTLQAGSGSAASTSDIAVTAAAWGIVGMLSAVLILAGGVFYLKRVAPAPVASGQSPTELAVRNQNQDVAPSSVA